MKNRPTNLPLFSEISTSLEVPPKKAENKSKDDVTNYDQKRRTNEISDRNDVHGNINDRNDVHGSINDRNDAHGNINKTPVRTSGKLYNNVSGRPTIDTRNMPVNNPTSEVANSANSSVGERGGCCDTGKGGCALTGPQGGDNLDRVTQCASDLSSDNLCGASAQDRYVGGGILTRRRDNPLANTVCSDKSDSKGSDKSVFGGCVTGEKDTLTRTGGTAGVGVSCERPLTLPDLGELASPSVVKWQAKNEQFRHDRNRPHEAMDHQSHGKVRDTGITSHGGSKLIEEKLASIYDPSVENSNNKNSKNSAGITTDAERIIEHTRKLSTVTLSNIDSPHNAADKSNIYGSKLKFRDHSQSFEKDSLESRRTSPNSDVDSCASSKQAKQREEESTDNGAELSNHILASTKSPYGSKRADTTAGDTTYVHPSCRDMGGIYSRRQRPDKSENLTKAEERLPSQPPVAEVPKRPPYASTGRTTGFGHVQSENVRRMRDVWGSRVEPKSTTNNSSAAPSSREKSPVRDSAWRSGASPFRRISERFESPVRRRTPSVGGDNSRRNSRLESPGPISGNNSRRGSRLDSPGPDKKPESDSRRNSGLDSPGLAKKCTLENLGIRSRLESPRRGSGLNSPLSNKKSFSENPERHDSPCRTTYASPTISSNAKCKLDKLSQKSTDTPPSTPRQKTPLRDLDSGSASSSARNSFRSTRDSVASSRDSTRDSFRSNPNRDSFRSTRDSAKSQSSKSDKDSTASADAAPKFTANTPLRSSGRSRTNSTASNASSRTSSRSGPRKSSGQSVHKRLYKRFRDASLRPDSETLCFVEEPDKYKVSFGNFI